MDEQTYVNIEPNHNFITPDVHGTPTKMEAEMITIVSGNLISQKNKDRKEKKSGRTWIPQPNKKIRPLYPILSCMESDTRIEDYTIL